MFVECYMGDYECESEVIIDAEVMRTVGSEVDCCECGQMIEAGEDFELDVYVDDGLPRAHITCVPCARIRRSLFKDGWIYGELWGRLEDDYGLSPAGVDDIGEGVLEGDWPETIEDREAERDAQNRREMEAIRALPSHEPNPEAWGPRGTWRCTACGAVREPHPVTYSELAHWRHDGQRWEHRCPGAHPQAGHMPAERLACDDDTPAEGC